MWTQYIREKCQTEVLELVNSWPKKRSFMVEWDTLQEYDSEFAQDLMKNPSTSLSAAESAVREAMPPDSKVEKFQVRVRGSENMLNYIPVRAVSSVHVGQMVTLEGIVRRVTAVQGRILDAVFQCARCGAVIREPQPDWDFKEPIECYKDQGGCGKGAASTRFTLLKGDSVSSKERSTARSEFIDTQKIEIQESPEGSLGTDQPEKITGYAEDDLCRVVRPGDRATLTGILRSKPVGKTTTFNWYLDLLWAETEEKAYEEVVLSREDEERIKGLSQEPDLYEQIVNSIAPTVYGYEVEKEAIALQLFGGVRKVLPNGDRRRGDIHVLLCGDPGTAKTELLRSAARLAPRGVFASGKSSSAAGLTAAAMHDEWGEGKWTLEAGALVLADLGVCAIDELDKMSETDAGSIHFAMEQQEIPFRKAGIDATLQSRCAVLAAANPKEGRFDEHSYLADQMDFDPTLLSRFDVIFPIIDKPNRERDEALAGHILAVQEAGETLAREKAGAGRKVRKGREKSLALITPPIEPDILRKYIAYARRSVFPQMEEEAIDLIKDYYVTIRAQSKPDADGGGAVPMTPRQLEALVRLSEASARIRLSDKVEGQDAERAKRIIETFLRKVASEGGVLDIDALVSGVSRARKDRFQDIIDCVEECDDGRGVSEEDILKRLCKDGTSEDKVRKDIQRLLNDGRLWNPEGDRYKVMRRGS
jgi:replicative DNA helicase Mcm